MAVDDSLFRRSGRKVHGAAWQYDGSAPGRRKLGFGTCFVTAGIIVRLPVCTRPVCLPYSPARTGPPARPPGRARASTGPASKVATAAGLVTVLAGAFPGRAIHVVAEAACHGATLRTLPRA